MTSGAGSTATSVASSTAASGAVSAGTSGVSASVALFSTASVDGCVSCWGIASSAPSSGFWVSSLMAFPVDLYSTFGTAVWKG